MNLIVLLSMQLKNNIAKNYLSYDVKLIADNQMYAMELIYFKNDYFNDCQRFQETEDFSLRDQTILAPPPQNGYF